MRPDDGRLNLWPVAVIGFFAVLAVASITPVVRLNSSPPPDFATLGGNSTGYWQTAVQVIQWKYPRTAPLPEQPPPEFTPGDVGGGAAVQAARTVYWAKLRQEWVRTDNWHTTVDFDASWIVNDVQSVSRGLHDFVVDHT